MSSFTDPPNGGKAPIRPPLRLIHPAPADPPPKKRRGRGPRPSAFTPEEERVARAALNTARQLFGSWKKLARALHFARGTLEHVGCGTFAPSPDLVVRLAKLLRVPIDSIITPIFGVVQPRPGPDGAA